MESRRYAINLGKESAIVDWSNLSLIALLACDLTTDMLGLPEVLLGCLKFDHLIGGMHLTKERMDRLTDLEVLCRFHAAMKSLSLRIETDPNLP